MSGLPAVQSGRPAVKNNWVACCTKWVASCPEYELIVNAFVCNFSLYRGVFDLEHYEGKYSDTLQQSSNTTAVSMTVYYCPIRDCLLVLSAYSSTHCQDVFDMAK